MSGPSNQYTTLSLEEAERQLQDSMQSQASSPTRMLSSSDLRRQSPTASSAPAAFVYPENTTEHPALEPLHGHPYRTVHPSINMLPEHSRDHDKGHQDNVPPRFELFLLADGEKKVVETPDTRIASTSIFVFNKEDHTLGNMVRSRLLKSPHVKFAGYRVPHPLFSTFELRLQTDGTITPRAALVQACRDLVNDLGTLSREFTKEWELRKLASAGQAEGVNGAGN
ncbi:MAG: hypothetical protein Q9187_002988 [Circinaria calcarea]